MHRFNRAQQDALLPSVEDGLLTLVGATTENPYFEVNASLLSRSTLFRLQPLTADAVVVLLRRALDAEGATADDDALAHLPDRAGGVQAGVGVAAPRRSARRARRGRPLRRPPAGRARLRGHRHGRSRVAARG
ncbi:MAG TPA: hypothetical protein VGR26_02780 [Acidimicrobiales bacterium]|nr:hypothetical protein [Acidimicrobiales bacterium]